MLVVTVVSLYRRIVTNNMPMAITVTFVTVSVSVGDFAEKTEFLNNID